ncbi:hypothetical protein GDO78_017205, partial [Eleutherodactylus coqui]
MEDLLTILPGCNATLLEIAEDLDTFHNGATLASVAGSSIGIAGGIVTLAGLALAPFTLGASLFFSGIGVTAAVAGVVTDASASIADIVNMKIKCSKAEDIVKKVDGKLKTFETASKKLHLLVKALEAMEKTGEIADALRFGGKVAFAGIEVGRILQLSKLSAGSQLAARGIQVASAILGVFAALFIVIDAVFFVKRVKELHNGTKTEAATEIRKYVGELKNIYQDLTEIANELLP